jgi:hypothetical protein
VIIELTLDEQAAEPVSKRRGTRRPWHAVTIAVPANACAAAQDCKGKRYLSSAAPRLPLPRPPRRGLSGYRGNAVCPRGFCGGYTRHVHFF